MQQKKIIFIDHSYHKKTRSNQFLIDYLKEFYEVEIHYDESWNQGAAPDWSKINYEKTQAIIFWQIFPHQEIQKKLPAQIPLLFFPMYDSILSLKFRGWLECWNVNIINFSKTLHKKLKRIGLKSYYLQYFPPPSPQLHYGDEAGVFFWQRTSQITIEQIAKILYNKPYRIHIHQAPDPNQEISPSNLENYHHFTYSKWIENKEEADNLVKERAFYIAPRSYEGIGLSFLEAMAMGKIVIANNAPTMNEYIQHNKNGFLFDIRKTQTIQPKNIKKMQERIYRYVQTGHLQWMENRKDIIDIITNKKQLENSWLRLILNQPITVIKNINSLLKNIYR